MIVNVEDLRRKAQRRLPRAVFGFIEGAAEDGFTASRNRKGFEQLTFRPRTLVDVSRVDQSTTVLGQRLETPVILAPTGLCGMATPKGELKAARAAAKAGTVFTLAVMSGVSIEDVARLTPGPHWFQLYVWRDRELTRSMVERAREAGYRALVVTVDTPVIGLRERDLRNGATVPPRITWRNALDMLSKVGWLTEMAKHPGIDFANFMEKSIFGNRKHFTMASYVNAQFDRSVVWSDITWLRSLWPGALALKGIMSAEDARRAVDHGVDGIIVSNHGGRQMDGLPGAIDILPEVVEAVDGRAEVILDGGVRRGGDVVKAIALGAKACMIGRPYLYGLGAAGEAGVEQVLRILRTDIERILALLGCTTLADLDPSFVRLPTKVFTPR